MSERGRILIVDDDENAQMALCRALRRHGYVCVAADNGLEGLMMLARGDFDVALVDLRMPAVDGMAMLRAMQEAKTDTVPIMLSGQAQIHQAVEAMKHGAFDFIEKPAAIEVVRAAIERARHYRRMLRRARAMTTMAKPREAALGCWPEMAVLLDADRDILQANDALAKRLKLTDKTLVGRPCHEALCGADHQPQDCPFLQDLPEGRVRTIEIRQAAWGGYFEVASMAVKQDGYPAGSMHVIRDITDRKAAEQVLRDAREQAELLVRSISSVLICLDEDRTVRQWNASAEETFGIRCDDAAGRALGACPIQWGYGAVDAAVSQCMAEGAPVRLDDIRFTRPDGRDGFLAITINCMKGADGQMLGVLILGRDITEHKLLEGQLAQAQKLEAIGQLAAGIAHEINTPVQYVGDNTRFLDGAFSDLLRSVEAYGRLLQAAKEQKLDPEAMAEAEGAVQEADIAYLREEIPRAIQQSLEGVEQVARIVRAMRDFSHPGVEDSVSIDVNRAVESTITVCRNEWKYVADMDTDLDPELPAVRCFPGELNQALLNLIVNAAHAIGDVVGDGSRGKGTIAVGTRRDGDWVEISIRDTGTGIPEDVQPRVFEPFFTTKPADKGTGQGLAIVRSVIVDKHQGTIAFQTEPGQGTTFIIRLPLTPETQSPQPATKESTDEPETASPVCR